EGHERVPDVCPRVRRRRGPFGSRRCDRRQQRPRGEGTAGPCGGLARAGAARRIVSRAAPPRAGAARRMARFVLALGFAGLLVTAAAVGALGAHGRAPHFSHHYPPDPVSLERPKVAGAAPEAPRPNTLDAAQLDSLQELARALPAGTLVRTRSNGWLLRRPVALTRHSVLRVEGGNLRLAPGTFVEAAKGGRIVLRHTVVTGVSRGGGLET